MSFACSQCHAEVADETESCAQCGAAVKSRLLMDAQPESDSRFPFWTILPWCLFAAAVLFLLPHLLPHSTVTSSRTPAPAAVAAASSSQAGSAVKTDPATAGPLTVTLYSAGSGRHVPVGKPVMISAYAVLPPGQSATVAISYDRDHGAKSLLSLAQGSLSSTPWTPSAPGHYQFTASALDSRKISAFSHPLSIWADAPKSARPASREEASVSQEAQVPLRPAVRRRFTARPAPQTPPVPRGPVPYHVAAAAFPVQHIADTLAGALRRRGFHAFVRPSFGRYGRRTYTVETGDYVGHDDAQKQVQTLQHDGYPAYLFRTR